MFITINNRNIVNFIAKKRWLRRLKIFKQPALSYVEWHDKKIYVDTSDWNGPSFHVLKWGMESYEKDNFEILRMICNQDTTFLDIGANIGIFSIKLAHLNKEMEIHAFEPEPITNQCLEKSVKQNDFKNIAVHKVALSNKNGQSSFYFDATNHGGHSLNAESIEGEGNLISHEINVELETLDQFVLKNMINKIDLIKMDVQRHEANVLEGGLQTLKKNRPIILMECYLDDLNVADSYLLKALKELNDYCIYEPKNNKVIDVLEYSENSFHKYNNNHKVQYYDFLFIPKEKKDEILKKINERFI